MGGEGGRRGWEKGVEREGEGSRGRRENIKDRVTERERGREGGKWLDTYAHKRT